MKTGIEVVRGGLFVGIVALALPLLPAYAGPFGDECGRGKGRRGDRLSEHIRMLNLAPEQQEKVENQHRENKEKMRELHGKLHEVRRQLYGEIGSPNPDKKKIDVTVSQLKELEAQLVDLRVESILKIKALLTSDQFETLHSFDRGERRERKRKESWIGKRGKEREMINDHIKSLNLTSEQRGQIEAQRVQAREKMRDLRESLMGKRRELRRELEKSDSDRKKLDSTIAEVKDLHMQITDQRVNNVLQMKGILTNEQFKMLQALERKERRGRKGGPGNDPMGSEHAKCSAGGPPTAD
jgi:Spy/CpxP family protein refolding chaperone